MAKFNFKNIEQPEILYEKQPDKSIVQFANGLPDEVCFGLSIEKNDVKIRSPFLPSYWQPLYFNRVMEDIEIYKQFYFISAGGAAVQPNIKRIYDGMNRKYQEKQSTVRVPYQLLPKHDILEERKKI